jgi:hypothetical protein
MSNAAELLDVISASHLPVTDRLDQHRRDIVASVERRFQGTADRSQRLASELAALLVDEGVVLSDEDSVRQVISDYLAIVADEEAALGDDENAFLANFLK